MTKDAAEQNDPPGLWLSVSGLAKSCGVSKQAVSRRAGRLRAQGLLSARPGPGGALLINVAEFDRATGEATDLARATNGATKGATGKASVYTHEQARRASYSADLMRLELEERTGKLIRVDEVVEALSAVGERLAMTIDMLPDIAEEVAAAVAKDGERGAYTALKKAAFDWRGLLAEEIYRFIANAKKETPAA